MEVWIQREFGNIWKFARQVNHCDTETTVTHPNRKIKAELQCEGVCCTSRVPTPAAKAARMHHGADSAFGSLFEGAGLKELRET